MPNWKEYINIERQKAVQRTLREEGDKKQQQAEQEYLRRQHQQQEEAIKQDHLRQVPGVMQRFGVKDFLKSIQPFWPRKSSFSKTETGYYLSDNYCRCETIREEYGQGDVSFRDVYVTEAISVDCRLLQPSNEAMRRCLHVNHSTWFDCDFPIYCKGSHSCIDFENHPELVDQQLKEIASHFIGANSKSQLLPWYKKLGL